MGDAPSFAGVSLVLPLFLLVVLATLVLLTLWTAYRAYRQPTSRRLLEHSTLLLLWLWTWAIAGPRYQAQWGYGPPLLFLGHGLLLAGRVVARQRRSLN